MMPSLHQNVLVFHTEKKTLINAREGSEQCLNTVFVYSTEGGIKGEGEKKESRTCGNFQSYIFNVYSAVS